MLGTVDRHQRQRVPVVSQSRNWQRQNRRNWRYFIPALTPTAQIQHLRCACGHRYPAHDLLHDQPSLAGLPEVISNPFLFA